MFFFFFFYEIHDLTCDGKCQLEMYHLEKFVSHASLYLYKETPPGGTSNVLLTTTWSCWPAWIPRIIFMALHRPSEKT